MICENIERLIDYAIRNSLIEVSDVYVVRNMFMETFGLGNWQEVSAKYSGEPVDELLQLLVIMRLRTSSSPILPTPAICSTQDLWVF